jgi:branched-chain amino acid transport system ATP-binding protein
LRGIDVDVAPGETVAIIGANGAGRTTRLRSIRGVVRPRPGSVRFRGQAIGGESADRIMARGIAVVPEGRKLFPSLSVEENRLTGAHARAGSGRWTLDAGRDP